MTRISTKFVVGGVTALLLLAISYQVFLTSSDSRDDFHVVEGQDGALYFYSYRGGNPPVLVRRNIDGSEDFLAEDEIDWHIEPELSPDGKRLIFAAGQSMRALSIKAIDLETGVSRKLVGKAGKSYSAPTYFKDGQHIAYNELVAGDEASRIWVAEPDGSGARELAIDVTGYQGQPDVSPDGRYVLFAGGPKGAEVSDLYVYDLIAEKTIQLTDTPDYERFPIFSPDGQTIWFSWREDENFSLGSLGLKEALDGKGTARVRWVAPEGDAYFVRFSPGGQDVLVSHGNWDNFRIIRLPLATLQ